MFIFNLLYFFYKLTYMYDVLIMYNKCVTETGFIICSQFYCEFEHAFVKLQERDVAPW